MEEEQQEEGKWRRKWLEIRLIIFSTGYEVIFINLIKTFPSSSSALCN